MNPVHLAKVASIQRSIRRAREEFTAAGSQFGVNLTRQDAAVLNVLRACVNAFLETARPRILKIGMVSAGSPALLIFLVSILLTRPIKRLTQYAHDIREGKKVALPLLAGRELKEMGLAFEKMREALEGKKYAEQYVQTLTHEIKSPLSAIRGAPELLHEGMPQEKPDTAMYLPRMSSGAKAATRACDTGATIISPIVMITMATMNHA